MSQFPTEVQFTLALYCWGLIYGPCIRHEKKSYFFVELFQRVFEEKFGDETNFKVSQANEIDGKTGFLFKIKISNERKVKG